PRSVPAMSSARWRSSTNSHVRRPSVRSSRPPHSGSSAGISGGSSKATHRSHCRFFECCRAGSTTPGAESGSPPTLNAGPAEGDKVFVRSTFSAQYMGGVPGIAAPEGGTPIKDIESWSVYRLKDGKIVEHWGLNDGFAIAMQAGALEMPRMEAPAGR